MFKAISEKEFLDSTKINHGKSKIMLDIEQFNESEHDYAEIVNYPHKNAYSCSSAYRVAAKKLHICIKPIVRGERVFLVKVKE